MTTNTGWLIRLRPAIAVGGLALISLGAAPPSGRAWVAGLCGVAFALACRLCRPWTPVHGLVAMLGCVAVVSWTHAHDQQSALSHLCGIAAGVLAMGLVATWCPTPRRLLIAGAAMLALGGGMLGVGLATTRIPEPKLIPIEWTGRLPILSLRLPGMDPAGLVNPNALAATGLLVAPLALALLFVRRRPDVSHRGVRLLGLLVGSLAVTVLVVTESRSAWGAAWLMLFVGLWRIGRWSATIRAAAIALAVVVSAGGIFATARRDPGLWEGLRPLSQPGRPARWDRWQGSIEARIDVWQPALFELSRAPWFGVGLNEFRHILRRPLDPTLGDMAHAHNMFLQTALDLGLPGLAVYLALLGYLLVRAREAADGADPTARCVAAGAGISLLAVHVFGLADAVPLGAKVGLLQWLASGLILAAWQIQRSGPHGGQ